MRKILLLLFLVVLSFTLIACGGGKDTDNGQKAAEPAAGTDSKPAAEASANAPSASKPASAIYQEPGAELSEFTAAIVSSEETFDGPLNSSDKVPMDAQMDRVTPNLALITPPQYDLLSMEDEAREEGKLMISGYDGIREKSGNIIKFSGKYVYQEDSQFGTNKKGDVVTEQGSLDTNSNTFIYESKLERGGQILDRTVYEGVILPDGTYLIQYICASQSSSDPSAIDCTAVFKRYNSNEYTAILANSDKGIDFTYDSLAGKGDVKAEDMAKAFSIKGKIIVSGGNVSYEK